MVRKNPPEKLLDPDDFHCIRCGKKPMAELAVMTRKWSNSAPTALWFRCVECQVFGYSRAMIRQRLIHWYHSSHGAKEHRFNDIYQEVIKFIDDVIKSFTSQARYRRGRFIKNKPRKRKLLK